MAYLNSSKIKVGFEDEDDSEFIRAVLKDHAHIVTLATGKLLFARLDVELKKGKNLWITEEMTAQAASSKRSSTRQDSTNGAKEALSQTQKAALGEKSRADRAALAANVYSEGNTSPNDSRRRAPGLGLERGIDGVIVEYDPRIANYRHNSPSWIVLAHELIHALHMFQGTRGQGELAFNGAMVATEELITVGLGSFANGELTENRLRAEGKLDIRTHYV